MDWSAVVGLGGLLLGAFTAYLSYRQRSDERKSVYREVLYSRQVNACGEIAQIVAEYLQLVREILDTTSNDRDLPDKLKKALYVHDQIRRSYSQHIVFVTGRMHLAYNSFIKLTRDMLQHRQAEIISEVHSDAITALPNYAYEIRESYRELVESMREMIGTNPLSQDALEIIGKSAT